MADSSFLCEFAKKTKQKNSVGGKNYKFVKMEKFLLTSKKKCDII